MSAALPPPWRIPLGAWAGSPAFILGGGPSLARVDLDRLRGRGRVIAVNNAGLDLAPWADVLYFADGWQRWLGWNVDRLDRFKGDKIVTRARLVPWPEAPKIWRVAHDMAIPHVVDGSAVAGVCGGSNAISLAWQLGASPIVLLGFDMRPGNYHSDHKRPPKPGQHALTFIPALERMARAMRGPQVVLNATPGSALRAFPSVDLEELLAMDDLAQLERDKYLRIWERDEYRRISPGMLEAERAFWSCQMAPGDRLVDFGAGTGRATRWFADRGLEVLAVDFVETALETDVPFVLGNLWSLGAEVAPADFAFCCDVLEHIPRPRVVETIATIRARTRRAAYLRIATRPDRMGRLIGARLHMTVEPGTWWRQQVAAQFGEVDLVEDNGRDVILIARP